MTSQFFLKTKQDIELFNGYPEFAQVPTETFLQQDTSSTNAAASSESLANTDTVVGSLLSPCGKYLAYSKKDYVMIMHGEKFEKKFSKLDLPNVYDMKFSPNGNFLSTWQRISAVNDQPLNVKIWHLKSKSDTDNLELVFQYGANSQNDWSLQFSKLDNYVIRQVNKQLRIVKIDPKSSGIKFDFEKPYAFLKQEETKQSFSTYLISPAENPTICTFTPEKAGKPAHLTIWPITEGEITKKITTKTFFKADSCQLKWNPMGNAVLCVATTDFDSSNQSYYGENTLYLLSFQGVNGTLGGNSVRVALSKEGPVHDFTWSPTSRQFGVVHGYMPATVTFFDIRGNVVHSLADQAKNTLSFSPTGRYILIAGFGNLQGAVDILDRHDKFKRISKFEASNTSVCEWSPGGEFILTATTSPRLRVDNGVRIWHVSGKMVFTKAYKELLKVAWRQPLCSANGKVEEVKDPILTNPNKDLVIHDTVKKDIEAKKELTPQSTGGKSGSGGAYKPPHARKSGGVRTVPGMANRPQSNQRAVPGMTRTIPGMVPKESKTASKNRKKRNNKKDETEGDDTKKEPVANKEISPEEKKKRFLLKKYRSIQTLKQKKAAGEQLELTQIQKIDTEAEVIKDLKAFGWYDEIEKEA